MIQTIFLSGAALLAAGFAAVQSGPPHPDPNADVTRAQMVARVDERFARLDANHDGRFTPEEGRALRERRRGEMADRVFDRIDADRSGSISREEMNQARAQRQARREQRMAGGPGMGGLRMVRRQRMAMRMFGPDGAVTREELRQRALERFDRADANRDGTLTAEERREARQQRREMRMRRGPGPDGPPPPRN